MKTLLFVQTERLVETISECFFITEIFISYVLRNSNSNKYIPIIGTHDFQKKYRSFVVYESLAHQSTSTIRSS